MPLVSKLTGAVGWVEMVCDSWDCDEHAISKAQIIHKRFRQVTGGAADIWVTSVPQEMSTDASGKSTSRTLVRLRQRRRRLDPTAQYLWVKRAESDQLYVFSTADLSGNAPPTEGEWLSADVAYQYLAEVLQFPGVQRARWSKAWHPPKQTKESDYWGPGPILPSIWNRSYDIAASRLDDRHGVRPNPNKALPLEIDPAELIEEIATSIPEARRALGGGQNDTAE
jgi:hypothetical protein